MNISAIVNSILFLSLLAFPLIAEKSTATETYIPGTGFNVLLYEPFDFAYVLFAGCLFTVSNSYFSTKNGRSIWGGICIGLGLLVFWFIVAFICVGQLHSNLGGIL